MTTPPERIDPLLSPKRQVRLHQERYDFARRMLRGLDGSGVILDAGCGVGYGSEFLSEAARIVVGIDNNLEALQKAKGCYARPLYMQHDLEQKLPFLSGTFSDVVLLEAIEHVKSPDRVLDNLKAVLVEKGRLIVSIPLNEKFGDNPYHLTLWDRWEDFSEQVQSNGFSYIGRSFKQPDNWTGVFSKWKLR